MKIKINGQDKEFSDSARLHDIIRQFCANSQRVIAEVNGDIVKAPAWTEKEIQEGDNIELITFVGGG